MSGGREPQKNLEKVLKMAIENTPVGGDNAEVAPPREMSAENQQFLSEAMSGLVANPVTSMKELLSLIVSLKDDDEDKEGALETVLDYVEDIDLAKDFHTIGGVTVMEEQLRSKEGEVRWRVLDIIAAFAQNNPYCQGMLLDLGWVPTLLEKIDKDPDNQVRIKALYAVSCLVRENDRAQDELVKNDGFSVILRAMQTNVEKLRVKGSFLITSLMISSPKFKDTLCDMGMVEQLVALLQTPHQSNHEYLMSALLSLVSDHQGALAECRRPELQLKECLKTRRKFLKGKEEYLEEFEHCKNLLKLLDGSSNKNTVDR